MRQSWKVLSAAFLVLVLVSNVRAADTKVVEKLDKEPKNDQEFLIWAIACDVNEMTLAERAAKKTSNEEVRKLANELATQHAKCRDTLLEQAKKLKVAVVAGTDKHYRETADRLAKLKGADFDRAYVRHVIEGHEKGLKMMKKWSKSTTDADIRKEVDQFTRTLSDHLEQARKVQKDLK
jgi:putative membrane protein